MKGSVIIVSFFIIGLIIGRADLTSLSIESSNLSFYTLCALMLFVGINIGSDSKILKSFRAINPRLILLPIVTIIGTLIGSAIISIFIEQRSLTDCLAVGSGFGYYSLSSIFITEYKGAELGTVALLSNILREIITLLLAPFLVKYFEIGRAHV